MTAGPPSASRDARDALDLEEAARLAEAHGLRALGERPPLRPYLAEVWRRRSFLVTLASGQSSSRHQNNRLGQLWAVLNPLFLIASYFFVFGLLLKTSRGVDNFIGFLSIGVVLFAFISSAVGSGARAVTNNIGLVRALRFPRALLPLSVTLTEFLANIPAFVLLFVLMLVTGEAPRWEWLLWPVVVLLMIMMLTGMSFVLARVVNISRDIANLIPVAIRLLRYVSGVFFPISHYAHGAVGFVLEYQPFALPLTLGRQSLMNEFTFAWSYWAASAGWAVILLTVGVVVFWRDEARYGRG